MRKSRRAYTPATRSLTVACAPHAHALVRLKNHGFRQLTLMRRNYVGRLGVPLQNCSLRRRGKMSLSNLLTADAVELEEHYPNRAEHTADGVVHAVGILAALVGGGLLVAVALVNRGVPMATASAIYAMCLMAMLIASAVYNLTKPNPHRRILRRLDEAAIFLLIAGSYTPFTIKLLPPDFAIAVTWAIWVGALAGAAGKVFLPQLSDRAWCFIYLAFGWLAVLILGPAVPTLPPLAIALLIVAGVTYSGGVLGMGEKYHPLPWAVLNYDEEEDAYVVPYTKEELKAAPADTISELTKNDGHAYRDQSFAFYKVDQYWS